MALERIWPYKNDQKRKICIFWHFNQLQPVAKGVAMEICVQDSRIWDRVTKLILCLYHACVLNLRCEPKFRAILIISVVIIKIESVTRGFCFNVLGETPLVTDSNFISTTAVTRKPLNLGSHFKLSTHAWYTPSMSLLVWSQILESLTQISIATPLATGCNSLKFQKNIFFFFDQFWMAKSFLMP